MGPTRPGTRVARFAWATACFVACVLAPAGAAAKITIWTNDSPAGDLWSDPGNWDNGIPSFFDVVFFAPVGGTSRQDIAGLDLQEMSMSGYTGVLTLEQPLAIAGDLFVDGTLDATAVGLAVAASLTVVGTLDVSTAMLDVAGPITVEGTLEAGSADLHGLNNLVVNGGTLHGPDASLRVEGSLTVSGGGLLDAGAGTLEVRGDLDVDPSSAATWSSGGTLRFTGSGTQSWTDDSPSSSYGHVVLEKGSPAGRVTLGSTVALGELAVSTGTLELSGGLTVSGSLAVGPGGALEVPPSTSGLTFEFHDVHLTDGRFSVSGSSHTLRFTAGAGGLVAADGSSVFEVLGAPSGRIRLEHDGVAGGDRWIISHDPAAALTFDHVEVQDSEAVGGTVTAANGIDGGNNVNWDFGAGIVTWTGLGPSDLWSDAANWSPRPPLGGDEVRFDPVGGSSLADLPGLVLGSMDMAGYTGVLQLVTPLDVAGLVVSSGTLDLGGSALAVGGDLFVGGSLVVTVGDCAVGGGLHVSGAIFGGPGGLVDVHGPVGGGPGAILDMGRGTLVVRSDADFTPFATVSFDVGGRLEGRADADYRIDFGGSVSLSGVTFEHTSPPVVARIGSASGALVVGGPLRVFRGVADFSGLDVTVGDLTDIEIGGTLKGEIEEGTGITLDGHLAVRGDFVYKHDRVKVTLKSANVSGNLRVEGDSAVVRLAPAVFVHVETGGFLEIAGGTGDVRGRLELDGPLHSDQWRLDIKPGATAQFENVDVSDSDASSGQTAVATGDSKNSGNNDNWMFPTAGVDGAPPSRLSLRALPNPFERATVVEYALPAPGTVAIEVFDVSGRVVRTLVSGQRNAGVHRAAWDGRDDAGRGVGSGTYFIRLRTPSGTVGRTARLLQ